MILCCLLAVGASAQTTDSVTVERLLSKADRNAGTLYFARQFLGRPYVAATLEVNDSERLVVNTRQLDCTTLVENVTALTLCAQRGERTFGAFKRQLQQLRYRQGVLDGYTSRLHYFTDWIEDNSQMGLVSEVQKSGAPFTAVQTINVDYMTKHPQAYRALREHPELVPVIAKQEKRLNGRRYRYIPKNRVVNSQLLRDAVHDGDIIAITCKKPGLDIAHLGFAVWKSDGLHLLNASQIHKKVVDEPMTLGQYLAKHPTHTGIRIIRVRNNTGRASE